MKEEFLSGTEKIADSLTEAQSHVVAYEDELERAIIYRYFCDEKIVQFFITPDFLKQRYTIVRNYLDNTIRHFLAK